MNVAVIVAGGKGTRMGVEGGKQFSLLSGKPLLSYALDAFERCLSFECVIVVVDQEQIEQCKDLIANEGFKKVLTVATGGQERQDSVANALSILPLETKIVAIHDGARPLITPEFIDKVFLSLGDWDGVVLGVPVTDTIKLVEEETIIETLPREKLLSAQTPQIFLKEPLLKAYEFARASGFYGTDDANLLEKLGFKVKMVTGSYKNIKVTTPTDLLLAEAILKEREKGKR